MKVAAIGITGAIRTALQSWGWHLTDEPATADVILTKTDQYLEIRVGAALHADDIIFLPIKELELKRRVELARCRRARLNKRLHDLRSPLNAIQGYAEIITETAQGDALRFASNIRTASDLLTVRLETIGEEGV